jgi:hypothetical protein
VLPLHYILIKLENLINISLEHRRKAKGFDAYGNVEKSGLEPENTIRKIVVLPIKLYPLKYAQQPRPQSARLL